MFLILFTTAFVLIPLICKCTTSCHEEAECIGDLIYDDYVRCYGFEACANSTIYMTEDSYFFAARSSIYSTCTNDDFLNCGGSGSCASAKSLISTSSRVSCTGTLSCENAKSITVEDSSEYFDCGGDHGCVYSLITDTAEIKARGQFSLNHARIEIVDSSISSLIVDLHGWFV